MARPTPIRSAQPSSKSSSAWAGVGFALLADIAVFSDDEADFAVPGPLLVIDTDCVGDTAVFIGFGGGYGRHHQAAFQGHPMDNNGLNKRDIDKSSLLQKEPGWLGKRRQCIAGSSRPAGTETGISLSMPASHQHRASVCTPSGGGVRCFPLVGDHLLHPGRPEGGSQPGSTGSTNPPC